MRKKYWDGPGGVYYNPISDMLFTLKPTGTELYNIKKNKFSGRLYEFHSLKFSSKEIAVLNVEHAVYLGEL